MHGKPSRINLQSNSVVFSGLDRETTIGRYHSLYADAAKLPEKLRVTAETEDGIIMGIEHVDDIIADIEQALAAAS